MKNLIYNYIVEEIKVDENFNTMETYKENLPHHEEIQRLIKEKLTNNHIRGFIDRKIRKDIITVVSNTLKNNEGQTFLQVKIIPMQSSSQCDDYIENMREEVEEQISYRVCEFLDELKIPGYENYQLVM